MKTNLITVPTFTFNQGMIYDGEEMILKKITELKNKRDGK